MVGSEELLQESRDYHRYVPSPVRGFVLDRFGQNISRRELFTEPVIDRLFEGMAELFKNDPSASGFEALSFLMSLRKVEPVADVWQEWMGEPFNTRPELGTVIYDCLEMSDDFLALIKNIYSQDTPFSVQNAERINFCSPPGASSEFGDSQNMAYFELVAGGKKRCFLVDVAAFYYHDVWAKAFEGESRSEVVSQGTRWLNEVPNSSWLGDPRRVILDKNQ